MFRENSVLLEENDFLQEIGTDIHDFSTQQQLDTIDSLFEDISFNSIDMNEVSENLIDHPIFKRFEEGHTQGDEYGVSQEMKIPPPPYTQNPNFPLPYAAAPHGNNSFNPVNYSSTDLFPLNVGSFSTNARTVSTYSFGSNIVPPPPPTPQTTYPKTSYIPPPPPPPAIFHPLRSEDLINTSIIQLLEDHEVAEKNAVVICSKESIKVSEMCPVVDDTIIPQPSNLGSFFVVKERTDNKKEIRIVFLKNIIENICQRKHKYGMFNFKRYRITVFVREVKFSKNKDKFGRAKDHKYQMLKSDGEGLNIFLEFEQGFLKQNRRTLRLRKRKDEEHGELEFELDSMHSNQNFRLLNENVKCPTLEVTVVLEDDNYMIFNPFFYKYCPAKHAVKVREIITKSFFFCKDRQYQFLQSLTSLMSFGVERCCSEEVVEKKNKFGVPIPIKKFEIDFFFDNGCFYYDSWNKIHLPVRKTPVMRMNEERGKNKRKRDDMDFQESDRPQKKRKTL